MSARWGQARIELELLKEEILREIAGGTPITRVYDDFQRDGRLTISDKAFYKWVKRFREEATQQSPRFNPAKASGSAQTLQQPMHVSPGPTLCGNPAPASPPTSGRARAVSRPPSPIIGAKINRLSDMNAASFDETWDGETSTPLIKRNPNHGND